MKDVLHFSGLNGIRAIAALAVLFSHITIELASFGLDPYVLGRMSDGTPKATSLAGFGVSIFFVLSGFLITYLLLEEKKIRSINIKHFYIRRVLRIWPLYYLYFFISILTLVVFDLPFEKQSTLYYIFLAANIPYIIGGAINFIAHYWSLGVEEQFYAFWPWIIKKSSAVLKVTVAICASLILLKYALRIIDIKYHSGNMSLAYDILNVTRFHCMLIGAIGAILYFRKNVVFLKVMDNFICQLLAWGIIFLVTFNKFHLISFLDNEIISVATLFLIMGQIRKKRRILNLDLPFFEFIGKISYGIYVLHPLVIFYVSKALSFTDKSNVFNYLTAYVLVILVTILSAYISYEFFEKRFLSLKGKYSAVRSAAVAQEQE
jgi:peptidoglycan/LPS O-acetylase OafA/YrhL